MEQKRNISLFISALVFAGASAAIVFFRQESRVSVDAAMFRVTDASAIDHVVLDTKKEKIDLQFNGSSWKVNSKYDADPQLIKVLMATLLQVAPRRPLGVHQRDASAERLTRTGTTVSIYAGSVLQKAFIAGGNETKTEAWFKAPGDQDVYLMAIPGYRVYASGVFEQSANDWRDKRIFNFNWRNFRKLTLAYPADLQGGFEIARQDDFLGVIGIDNPDSTRLNTFLNDVLKLTADQIAVPGAVRVYDSLVTTKPFMTLTVEDIAHRTYALELFGPTAVNGKIAGRAPEGDIVVFDRRRTFPILKKKPYFKAQTGSKF